MTSTGMKQTLVAPTAKELKKGPVVTLTRPGWVNYSWPFVGLAYPIRFVDGEAVVLEDHFDEWLGEDLMASYGITVHRPKKAAAKAAPTTTATEKVAASTTAVKPTTKKRSSK